MTIYRIQCELCMRELDDHPGKPEGWTDIVRYQSLRDSRRVTPRPGEVNFSLSDWQTHFGVCPECSAAEEAA